MNTPSPIICFNIGWSTSDEEARNIGRDIPKIGYDQWMVKNLDPVLSSGFNRIHLHNPGGANKDEAMDFDQFSELDQTWWRLMRNRKGLSRLGSVTFVEASRSLYERFPTADVTDYLGSMVSDSNAPDSKNDPGGWLAWASRAVLPSLDSDHQIGLDASSGIIKDSVEHKFVEILETLGARPIIEAWPLKTSTHLHKYDCLTLWSSNGKGSYPTYLTHPQSSRGLLTGEMRVMLHGLFDDKLFDSTVRSLVDEGCTPMISSTDMPRWIKIFGEPV